MASAVFFLSSAGTPLLARNYRGDIPMSCVHDFARLWPEFDRPCFSDEGISYMYIRHANLILLAVAKSNANVASVFVFLHRLVAAFAHYVTNVEEESVRDNHVILYELLDEMMDYGLPQNTDINLLQDYVTQTPYQLQALSALTDKVSWRPPGIYYQKNELFVDVIEVVSATLDWDGKPISYSIAGRIALKVFLSGMPVLTLGINDIERSRSARSGNTLSKYRLSKYVKLEDVTFHQSVSLDAFDVDRTITFIPADGQFDLMTYRVVPNTKPLFLVNASLDIRERSRVLVSCAIESQYKKRQACTFAEFTIPVPADCDSPRFRASYGSVVYAPELNAIIWRVTDFVGGRTATMKAELLLPSVGDTAKPTAPVQARFEIPALAASGLEVRSLRVTEDQLRYNSYPWVRYFTKSGDYEVRLNKNKQARADLPGAGKAVAS